MGLWTSVRCGPESQTMRPKTLHPERLTTEFIIVNHPPCIWESCARDPTHGVLNYGFRIERFDAKMYKREKEIKTKKDDDGADSLMNLMKDMYEDVDDETK